MNTELSPEITRTCSKGHGKIANNNSFRLSRNNIRKPCLEQTNSMLQEHIIAQKSLTDHEPKRHRRYDGTHVNIASFINSFRQQKNWNMAKQISSRHVYELDALTTKHYMTN